MRFYPQTIRLFDDVMKHRCINLDWLEVFCEEDPHFPLTAENLRKLGWVVEQRAYGTPMYAEMYTLYRGNTAVMEVRRNPYQKKSEGGIFADGACHVRYCNRTCYGVSPVQEMRNFIERSRLLFKSISRVDICMDFLRFEDNAGTSPHTFIINYLNGHLIKVGQNKLRAVSRENDVLQKGDDVSFAGRICGIGNRVNSLKWGGKKCPVSTKLYNKSLEMKEVKRKDYIIDQWVAAGMVERKLTTDAKGVSREILIHDGKEVDVWRLEYSIKLGGATFVETTQGEIIDFSLSAIESRDKLLSMFCALSNRFFDIRYAKTTSNGKAEKSTRLKRMRVIASRLMERAYKPMQLSVKKDLDRFKRIILKKLSEMVTSDAADTLDKVTFSKMIGFVGKFYAVRDMSPEVLGKVDPYPLSIDTLIRAVPLLSDESRVALLDKCNLLLSRLYMSMTKPGMKQLSLVPIVDDEIPF